MNEFRRQELQAIIDKLKELKKAVKALKEEEEDYRDNMPENLQGSERYKKADEASYYLTDAIVYLKASADSIELATDRIGD